MCPEERQVLQWVESGRERSRTSPGTSKVHPWRKKRVYTERVPLGSLVRVKRNRTIKRGILNSGGLYDKVKG